MNQIKVILEKKGLGGLFASGGTTFIFRIGGLGLNFLVTYIITNFYGDKVFGNYSLAFTMAQATGLLFALGFPNAIISYLGLKSINDPFSQHMLKNGLKVLVPLALVPLIIYLGGAEIIATEIFNNPDFSTYINIVAFTVPVLMLHEFILYFFIATGNYLKFNIFMFVVPNIILLFLLLIIQNVPEHYTLMFYLISLIGVLGIECCFAFKKTVVDDFEKISAKQFIKFASPMMFSGLMLYLLNWTDVFILGAMVTEEEVGHYNLAYKIASLAMLVIISVNVVIAPRIAALFNEGNLVGLHATVRKATHLIIIFTTPIVAGIIVFSDFILSLFGESFDNGKEALIIVSAGFFLNAVTGNVDQVLNMSGNQKLLRNITIAGFVLNAVLNLMLIPHYGINGAAIASLITNVAFNFTCVYYIKKKLGFYSFA